MEDRGRLLPLYLTQAWRRFAISLLSLFSAIYIYKTFQSLTFVFLFFFLLYFSKLLTNFLAEELSLKVGLKNQIQFGLLLLILSLCLMFFSEKYPFLLFSAAVFWGSSTGFYWFGRHGLMVKLAPDGHYGLVLGKQEIVSLIPVLLSPILGGALISLFGYKALFSVCLLFIIFSLLTLRSTPEIKTHIDTSPVEVLKLFKTHKRMFLAYFGDSAAASIYTIAFPLYLFLILRKELSIGEFFSLSLILVAVLNFFIGKLVDLKGKRELIGFGSVFSFLIWIIRVIFKQVNILFLADVSDRVVEKMTAIPLEVLTYEKALDGGSTGRAILFREMAIISGAIFVSLVLMFLNNLQSAFVSASILTLFPLLLIRKRGIYGNGHQKV
jgi:MFS family permease